MTDERTYVAICRLPGGETAFRYFELPENLPNHRMQASFHSLDLLMDAGQFIIVDVIPLREYKDFKPLTGQEQRSDNETA